MTKHEENSAVSGVGSSDVLERDKATHIASQWRQAKGLSPKVTCECGLTAPLRFLFRCLYCGAWFCQTCAENHFNKSREQYNRERSN